MNLKYKNGIMTLFLSVIATVHLYAQASQPNVLFFAFDDLSDWISPMGYQQAKTPNFERLAARGVTFQYAHTAGIYCAPARTAIFTGRHASTTGFYANHVHFALKPEIKPLQVAFSEAGYATFGGGKLFHHSAGWIDLRGWDEFYIRSQEQRERGWPLDSWTTEHPAMPVPYPNSKYNRTDKPTKAKWFLEWGAVLNENEEIMADTMRTNWACKKLQQAHHKPFFLGLGLYAPHFPNYVPQKYFDMYDRDALQPPEYLATDLEDLPEKIKKAKQSRGKIHQHLEKIDGVKDAIHGYLASVSYADAMLGRVLDALDSGPNADNTIIVIWSDHGYHHGQKFDWGKHTLWERTSNVPFMWAGPGIAKGKSVDTTVSLIDIYPTLLDLCSIPQVPDLDGVSMAAMLKNPKEAKDRNVLLPGMKPNEYAIINQRWRYIRYADATEELYDVRKDPNEWTNLADTPEYAEMKTKLAAEAPQTFAEEGANFSKFKLTFKGDQYHWEKKNK
ncbi:MAG: sulfatase [Verrucomicrobiota bacterium]